jgi:hypothetical protein
MILGGRATARFARFLDETGLRQICLRACARMYRRTALTGRGSDICLEEGFLPVPVHFYSPIPDLNDLRARRVWDARSPMTGIDFREASQLALLADLGQAFGAECRWPLHATENPADYFVANSGFSYGCAASTHSMIRRLQPATVIEIGSGYSSRVISAALELNRREHGMEGRHMVVDPYPDELLKGSRFPATDVLAQRVELLDPSFVDVLKQGDVLFIDSGHTVRTGGDVNFLYLEVLPRLAAGVVVHVHDIALPREYPEVYATTPAFRQFWTEQYLLQAFLCFNPRFRVLLALNWLMIDHPDAFRRAFPLYDPSIHASVSGSFWFSRVDGTEA